MRSELEQPEAEVVTTLELPSRSATGTTARATQPRHSRSASRTPLTVVNDRLGGSV